MTEAEWLACNEPRPMLALLQGKHHTRKLALFACACCRRIDHLFTDERSRQAIDVVEQFYTGGVVHQAFVVAQKAATDAHAALFRAVDAQEAKPGASFADGVRAIAYMFAAQAAMACFGKVGGDVSGNCCGALRGFGTADIEDDERSRVVGEEIESKERATQCGLLREIFGNPFHSVTVDPAWLTSTVKQLAQGIYDDRAFDRMPILADALQDAGCDNDDILNHSRGSDPHVRGCWVVDLLLGKS